jgi:hypothetical protein
VGVVEKGGGRGSRAMNGEGHSKGRKKERRAVKLHVGRKAVRKAESSKESREKSGEESWKEFRERGAGYLLLVVSCILFYFKCMLEYSFPLQEVVTNHFDVTFFFLIE